MSLDVLLGKIIIDLLANKKGLQLVRKRTINNNGGYYDGKDISVAITPRKKIVSMILVHEYCHFLQELDERNGVPLEYEPLMTIEYNMFWDWLESEPAKNKQYDGKLMKKIAQRIAALELDCEKRVVKLIDEYDLEGKDFYIKQANSYVMFYKFAAKHRKWCRRGSPMTEKLVNMMPNRFISLRTKMSKEYEDFCLEHIV